MLEHRQDETDRARRNALRFEEQKRDVAAALASSSEVEQFLASFGTSPDVAPHAPQSRESAPRVVTDPHNFVRA